MTSTFTQAHISYAAVVPMLVIFGAALVGVLVESFLPRAQRYWVQLGVSLVGIVASFLTLVLISRNNQGVTAGDAVVIDGPALMLQGTVLVISFFAVMLMAERFDLPTADAFTQSGASVPGSPLEANSVKLGATTTEIFPLVLFSVGGMMLFVASGDLLVMFIALEVLSLPLYILTGMARRRRLLSQEASLKYFLLGAFSSAFFLFGSALVYGATGTIKFADLATAIGTVTGRDDILIPGAFLIGVGLLFKVSAAPFHGWAPDVYQGAPSPVSGFMATTVKVAGFGALLRMFYVALDGLSWNWQPLLAIVAVLTMVVGAVFAVTQTDMKRLLAYSSISHAGFLLVGVVALNKTGLSGTMFYLVAYSFTTLAAFGMVPLVRSAGSEATHLSQWAGLGKTSPVVAATFSFLLLGFAGIPLTSGFTAKFALFSGAVGHGATWLVVVAMVMSAVTAFVYIRIIVLMYFSDPNGDTHVLIPSPLTGVAVTVGALATLVLGVAPAPLLNLAQHSALFIR
ncbi:NADH-quinone oxidoreductase subunit NuoN [Flexivirga oryzae]|uniref:NADH-quinone oxidoreductase subunit N n=1 Tax=Flexivirga oryzae TaxID=1794944 RepID=A0A839NC07_9MICO|nr:NADH-quinone oxidoreductase subunit N [Flexivirga oryzae]